MSTPQVTYAAAGVDTEAGDKAVELMKDAVRATHGPQVLGGVGGFAGLYDASLLTRYRRPLRELVQVTGSAEEMDDVGFPRGGQLEPDWTSFWSWSAPAEALCRAALSFRFSDSMSRASAAGRRTPLTYSPVGRTASPPAAAKLRLGSTRSPVLIPTVLASPA